MPRTRISCPNCRQPVTADIQQLFDVNENPAAKQQFLSGQHNLIQCPNCGYQGNVATPIVYHDPQKELLLTFVPPEIGLPRDEQERLLGSLINQVVNRLPPEKRKAYLLRPQANLTLQSLVEKVLEGEGITREMIQAQQERLSLLQRLIATSDSASRVELLKQQEELIDPSFFALLGRLGEAAAASGDRQAVERLQAIQSEVFDNTTLGSQIKEQTGELQAAAQSLQEAGRELTREKLLEIVLKAPNDTRLSALVSMARPAMDYAFFQLLSDRIDRAREKGRQRLIQVRDQLLELTRQYDAQVQTRLNEAGQQLNRLLQAPDLAGAVKENLPVFDEFFMQALNQALEEVRGKGDLERLGKLQEISNLIQEAAAPPVEVGLIEDLLEAPDEAARLQLLEEHADEITPEFTQMLAGFIHQVEQSNEDPELLEHLKAINRQARRFSMQRNLKG
jgi:hypothetical protein